MLLISDISIEKRLRTIMYSAMGYVNEGRGWHKAPTEIVKHKKKKGEVRCWKCKNYEDKEFMIPWGNKYIHPECERIVRTKNPEEVRDEQQNKEFLSASGFVISKYPN